MRLLLGVLAIMTVCAVRPLGQCSVHAQSLYDLYGSARSSSLGYASTALVQGVGVHANPAAPAEHRRRLASVFVRQSYGLSDLQYGASYVTVPIRWGSVSAGASTLGASPYREVHLSLGVARRFRLGTSRHVSFGVLSRYYYTGIDGYGSAHAVGLHLGLLLQLLPSLHLGVHATNVNGPSLRTGELLPQSLAVGFQYRVAQRILFLLDAFKDIAFPLSVRSGLEVRPIEMLTLRTGVATAPTRFTGGAGLRLGRLRTHLAAEQHPQLGWSPSASVEIHW